MKPESLTRLHRIEGVLREYDTPMSRYLADTLNDSADGRPEDLLKLRRVEGTLRATGAVAAAHLADDIHLLIDAETGSDSAGLAPEELLAIKVGRPIDAIKMVRARKGVGSALFGLKEAKDFVEAAGEKLGYFRREAPNFGNRWTTAPFFW